MQFPEDAAVVIDQALNFIYSFGPLAEKTVILGWYPSAVERFDRVNLVVCSGNLS